MKTNSFLRNPLLLTLLLSIILLCFAALETKLILNKQHQLMLSYLSVQTTEPITNEAQGMSKNKVLSLFFFLALF